MLRKLLKWGLGVFAVLFVIGLLAPDPEPAAEAVAPEASAAPAAPPVWDTVASWTGTGIKETETFAVPSGEWRVAWTATPTTSGGGSVMQIMVYAEGGRLVTLASNSANLAGPAEESSVVRAPAGRYYLAVNAANVSWGVRVEAPQP